METKIKSPKRKNQNAGVSARKSGKRPLVLAILALTIVAAATKVRGTVLREKEIANNIKIEQIKDGIAQEEERKQELEEYEDYITSKEFIIETAREKLGLVFENEILFQPKEE